MQTLWRRRWHKVKFRFTDNLPEETVFPTTEYSGHVRTPGGAAPPKNTIVRYDVEYYSGLATSRGSSGNIPVDGDGFAHSNSIGELWLVAYANEYAPSWTGPHFLKPNEPLQNLDIVLDEGVAVEIAVVDQSGRPVSEAVITALPEINGEFGGFAAKYTAKADGRYMFGHLADSRYQFRIEAEGCDRLTSEPVFVRDGSKITFELRRRN